MYHLSFPDIGYPTKAVQFEPPVEMDGLCVHDFPVTQIEPPSFVGFDRSDTTAAVVAFDTRWIGFSEFTFFATDAIVEVIKFGFRFIALYGTERQFSPLLSNQIQEQMSILHKLSI